MRKTLYIGNLTAHQDPREIERLMSRHGTIVHTTLLTDPDMLRRCGGFAVVEMQHEAEARAAMEALNGVQLHGSILNVRWASAGEQTASGYPPLLEPMNV